MRCTRDHILYEQILGINFKDLLEKNNPFIWVDMCCGLGVAAETFVRQILEPQYPDNDVRIYLVDLTTDGGGRKSISFKIPRPFIIKINDDVESISLEKRPNLITCVYGFHMLRRKVETLERWYNQLADGGLIAFNLHEEYLRIKTYSREITLGDYLSLFPNVIVGKSVDGEVIKIQKDSQKFPNFDLNLNLDAIAEPSSRKFRYYAPCSIYSTKLFNSKLIFLIFN